MLATLLLLALASMPVSGDTPPAPAPAPWWDAAVEASLDRLPDRRGDWRAVLLRTPPPERAALAYLVAYLPLRDLKATDPALITANAHLAVAARAAVPWGVRLPDAVFLDAVVPHASVTEPREPMRDEFFAKYLPLVKDCQTPGEAAQKLNKSLFADYKVTYNTRRLRTDQSARESIAQGMATCTGLSIMLVEACRAVAVPARLATIASWPGRGGNHTWVEVWDGGSWHFVGAAEPDANGLDHAWFAGDASKAIQAEPRHAIWAATYRPTGATMPLAWNPSAAVPGENVTERYTRGNTSAPAQRPRLMVEVRQGGERVEAEVTALERATGATVLSGKSLGPRADINQHLCRPATAGESFLVLARRDGREVAAIVTVGESDTVARLDLDRPGNDLVAVALSDRFSAGTTQREAARALLAGQPARPDLRERAWAAYRASPAHAELKAEFDARHVRTADRDSPYLWRHVGAKPKDGWSLVIAMHGGGGAPKRVNDGQWHGMFERYYRDHPEGGGYVYLALRAPNDEWNGFYDDAIGPLVERLIRQFVLFGEVNPDRVSILGASHGGYGAFVIGPKLPDRFAAIHASAAAPTDGETMGENLRNVRFTFMVGERDAAYGRADRCQAFAKKLEGWKAEFGGYPGGLEWKPGVGHSVPDRDKLAELIPAAVRDPWPTKIVWKTSDTVLRHSYWVEMPEAVDNARIVASADPKANRIEVDVDVAANAPGLKSLAFWIDSPIADLSRPLTIAVKRRKPFTIDLKPSLETFCQALEHRADPRLAAPARIVVVPLGDVPGK